MNIPKPIAKPVKRTPKPKPVARFVVVQAKHSVDGASYNYSCACFYSTEPSYEQLLKVTEAIDCRMDELIVYGLSGQKGKLGSPIPLVWTHEIL